MRSRIEIVKRVFDLGVVLLLLLPTALVVLFIALLIKLESRGPVFFKQQRIGRFGNEFLIYKFRSMVVGAESKGPYFTRNRDPRITRVGRVIRKTSLDELPQLINVLKGDMSLVGPRPNVSEQRVDYTEHEWNKRNRVRPGITGLAQATLRSSVTREERTRLDLEYVDRVSLTFDLWIVLLTVRQVLLKGGQ